MKIALVLASILCLDGQTFAGGMIGGVPPAIMVETQEFLRLAGLALRGDDLIVDNELMQPENLDIKERTIVARSKTDPSKAVTIKAEPEKH